MLRTTVITTGPSTLTGSAQLPDEIGHYPRPLPWLVCYGYCFGKLESTGLEEFDRYRYPRV